MPDFNVRSDSVNVEQIMEQIRARIREKRGVDYTEQQIRELAAVKLEKFLDPRGVRSDLLNEFRRSDPDPNFAFEDDTLFRSTRGVIQFMRRLLRPLLKLFFNPNPLIHVLHMQSEINHRNAGRHQLYYELIHNLVVETTRLGIEVKNLRMRVESLDARVDFNERRARALEGAVMYRPDPEARVESIRAVVAPPERIERTERPERSERPERPLPRAVPSPAPSSQASHGGGTGDLPGGPTIQGQSPEPAGESAGQRSKRRRRRRGRRGGAAATAAMGSPGGPLPGSDGSVSLEPGNSSPVHPGEPAAEREAFEPSPSSDDHPHAPSIEFGDSRSDDEP